MQYRPFLFLLIFACQTFKPIKINDPNKKQIRSFYEQGKIFTQQKNYISATQSYQKAYQRLNSSLPLGVRGLISYEYALSLKRIKAYQRALIPLQVAINLEKQKHFSRELPKFYYTQAILYIKTKNKKLAKKTFQQTLNCAYKFSDNRYIILAKNQLESFK